MMKRMRQLVVLGVLVAIGWTCGAGCAPQFDEPTCESDDDCFSDEQCVEGVCRLATGPSGDAGSDSGGDTQGETAGGPVALGVSPESVEVAVGRRVQLHAAVFDGEGNRLAGEDIEWTSTKSDVAAIVSGDGSTEPDVAAVEGRKTGTSTITATLGELSASAEVEVVESPVHRLEVEPSSAEIQVEESVQLSATTYDRAGNELTNRQVTWEAVNPGVATVDDTGEVTGKTSGKTEINASSEGKTSTVTVFVVERRVASVEITPADPDTLEVGNSTTLVAMPKDDQDEALCDTQDAEGTSTPCGRAVSWTSGSPTIASVDDKGNVTAKAAGTVRIFAKIEGASASVELPIERGNAAPMADAGMDKTTVRGTAVTLDGSGSSDPDGDALTYTWSLTSKPSGSSATLGSTSGSSTMLTPDVLGEYTVELMVDDGMATATDTVKVTATNQEPTAEAGPDASTVRGTAVTLDGSGSSDPDGDSLTYTWSLTSKPSGSSATLGSTSGSSTMLTPDVLGDYTVELMVDDGMATAQDTVTVTAANQAPTADAGSDKSIIKGTTANLDGSGSSDPDGDTLTYTWSIDSKPSDSSASLGSTSGPTTSLTPDVDGDYIVKLTVDDQTGASNATASDTVTVTATNQQPTAEAGSSEVTEVSTSVTLDGTNSSDPDSGDALSYSWSVSSKPSGASVTFGSPMMASTSFSADTVGEYAVELTVDDGSGASNATAVDTVTVWVAETPGASGDVVISEIMDQPDDLQDSSGEWFEIYNPTSTPWNLNGCTVAASGGSSANSTTVGSDLAVPPGGYITLAVSSSPGFMPDYDYSGAFVLEDSGDEVTISCNSTQIDGVQYDGGTNFPSTVGASKTLDPGKLTATDNDTGSNWCDASSTYGTNDKGTPGAANDSCP